MDSLQLVYCKDFFNASNKKSIFMFFFSIFHRSIWFSRVASLKARNVASVSLIYLEWNSSLVSLSLLFLPKILQLFADSRVKKIEWLFFLQNLNFFIFYGSSVRVFHWLTCFQWNHLRIRVKSKHQKSRSASSTCSRILLCDEICWFYGWCELCLYRVCRLTCCSSAVVAGY